MVGIYLTDGRFDTLCNDVMMSTSLCAPKLSPYYDAYSPPNSTLTLEGMFMAGMDTTNTNNGFNLKRKGNNSGPTMTPGETFVYRPDFLLSTVKTLGTVNYTWKEPY